MANGNSNAVLRRKAVAAREVYQARAMSPVKALRLALSKSADELLELSLVVRGCEYEFMTAETLTSHLSDESLLMLLEGPDHATGVVSFDISATSALVEQNTMGRVSPLSAEPRPTTNTDAALVAPLIDDVLLRLAVSLEGLRDMHWVSGYAFGVRIENVRLLKLALDAPDFHVFRASVDLGGLKQGNMLFAIPDREPIPDAEDPAESQKSLGEAVMVAQAAIDAVLYRVSMPLAEVSRLKIGDVIPVPRDALQETRLETRQEGKGRAHCLGVVALGQVNGMRAVRLTMEELAEARAAGFGQSMEEDFGASDFSASDFSGLGDEGGDDMPMGGGGFGLPPMPQMDEEEESGGLPDLPGLPDLGGGDDLPDLSDLPALDIGGDGDLPAFDDLPPLDDLPDLSDLPELGGEEDEGFPSMAIGDLPDLPSIED